MQTKIAYSDGVIEILGLHSPSENLFIAIINRQPDDSKGGYTSKSKELKNALSKLAKVISDIPAPAPNIIFGGDSTCLMHHGLKAFQPQAQPRMKKKC